MRLIHSIVPWFSWSAFLLLQNHVVHCYKVLCSQDPQVYPPSTVHTPCYSTQWKTIVTFGDSWTDNGKGPLSETSYLNEDYLGRMSNGPTWAEYLSKSSGSDLYNFAFSGATANNKIIPRSTLDVGQQIQLFFMTTDTKQLDPLETLYILWIGVNDVHDMFVNNINSTDALEPIINSVISSIDEQMVSIIWNTSQNTCTTPSLT
ncbi:hypothetical protein BDF14DRAFT_142986 [Spinellus fusiger]|nr:hypothetical protein BDF14DRAFT_142986 [Spinellus fusiger]